MPERLYHHFTLLDGEMVIDTMPGSQKQERRYLIYDMMAINQIPIVEVFEESTFKLSSVIYYGLCNIFFNLLLL